MRTIIINTLGEEEKRHELLFLPFREDQLIWLNTNMGGIGACAEKIVELYNSQDKRQDYRLIVLADLGGYADIDRDEIRSCYRGILNAHMNLSLFQPLAEERKIPPRNITVVYVITRTVKGSGKITAGRQFDYVLGLPADRPFDTLELVRLRDDGREEHLDVTGVFAPLLKASGVSRDFGDPERHKANVNHFRNHVGQTVEVLQKCRFTPAGSMQSEMIPVMSQEFFPMCTDPELIWTDLQLNLSEMLARQSRARRDRLVELKLVAHREEELAFRFRRGMQRVRILLNEAPDQTYFPLENRAITGSGNLTNKIWAALMEKEKLLPGVKEANDHRKGQDVSGKMGPVSELREAWLRMGREKKRFQGLCDELQRNYDPTVVREQQQTILEICAGEFRRWRSGTLDGRLTAPDESKAVCLTIPELDTGELERELHQAQIRCSAMAADKLEDYLDLRQEAEEIKADFRKTAKFWKPDCKKSNTKYFLIYSLVLAALFLLQMLVPYVGITMGQGDAEPARYIHLLVSAGVFLGAYLAGLLLWLKQMCRELGEHSRRMSDMIRRSGLRRMESIEAVVRAYAEELPCCTILHENLQEKRMLHAMNMDRYARCRTHMELLKRAEELLQELETELQLSAPAMDRLYKPEQITRGIDYQQPPGYPGNIPYYMLLSDEWGDGVC